MTDHPRITLDPNVLTGKPVIRWHAPAPNGALSSFFDASAKAQLKQIDCHKGCSVTSLIKEWAASAEVASLISSWARR